MPADDRDWDAPRQPPAAGYDVGYGKPPKATRFQPGTSGNPRGRPRGSRNRSPSASSMQRMQAIVLQEAYRLVTVREGDRPVDVPLFQAAMRSLAVNAAKGQPRALALLVSLVDRIERERRRDHREAFAAAVEYKVQMTRWLAEQRTRGLPEPPMLPHPDHLIIDPVAGSVVLRGPWTEEMKGNLGSADGDARRARPQDSGRKGCIAEAGEECAPGRGARAQAERRPEDRRLPRQLQVGDGSRSRRIGPEFKHTKAARHLRPRRAGLVGKVQGCESSLDFGAQQSVSVDEPRRSFGAAGRPDSLGLGPSVRGRPRIPRDP